MVDTVPFFCMETKTFFEKLQQSPLPVVVDLWAPWCGPCKAVKPTLEKLAQDYNGRVDLWEINADESADLLRELHVYGIPTLIVYNNGKETLRYVGAKPASALRSMFESLATGSVPTQSILTNGQRALRFGAGLVIAGIGTMVSNSWILYIFGAVVVFTAVYDRCPIWKAITGYFKQLSSKAEKA